MKILSPRFLPFEQSLHVPKKVHEGIVLHLASIVGSIAQNFPFDSFAQAGKLLLVLINVLGSNF